MSEKFKIDLDEIASILDEDGAECCEDECEEDDEEEKSRAKSLDEAVSECIDEAIANHKGGEREALASILAHVADRLSRRRY